MFSKFFLTFFLSFCAFICVAAQDERFVRPIDEGKRDASFNSFRNKLITAVKNRDVKTLLAALDPNITASFGGDEGIEDFKRMWQINDPKSTIWEELLTVLTNGGKFSKEGKTLLFSAPYSFSEFPADLDVFEYEMIFGNNVNLREKPDLAAKVIARLSYNIVQVDYENSIKNKGEDSGYLWLKIKTLGEKKGFVNAKFVRSPIDYRAIFVKKNGRWKMTAFVAGD